MGRFVKLFAFFGTFLVAHQQEQNINDTIWNLFQIPVPPTTISTADECKCVPYYLCRYNNMVTTDGRGIINVKAGLNPCSHYMDFCCKLEDVTATAMTPLDDMKPGCGWRNSDGVGFRTVGDFEGEAKFGEFPWMVAILHEERFEGLNEALASYQCGGSLIHPRAVITAAHCVTDRKKNLIIRVGEWDSQMTKEIYPSQDRTVRSITVHPDYYAGGLFNDIAFLLLDAPVNMTIPNVGVACLPPQGTVIPGGTTCFASGWGKKIFGKKGEYQAILKKIDLPIVERTRCQNDLRSTRLGKYFRLDRSFICAGGEDGKDTCKGDGGSPLVCAIPGQKGRYQQAGIVAWGIGCGTKGVPGAYANVALFRNWTDDQMALNNLDTMTYAY